MVGKVLVLLWLFLTVVEAAQAQAGARAASRQDTVASTPRRREGSWSAAASNGATFMGTWTAVLDSAGAVTGSWTVVDAQGKTRADGAWSAAKSPDRWTGAWRAVVTGRPGEFSGSWAATIDGKPDAPLADLFAKALQGIVSGTWRLGGRSGAWSIRTFE